jgi:hypothetical protein
MDVVDAMNAQCAVVITAHRISCCCATALVSPPTTNIGTVVSLSLSLSRPADDNSATIAHYDAHFDVDVCSLDPPLIDVPAEEWFCPDCQCNISRRQSKRSVFDMGCLLSCLQPSDN